MYSCQNTVFAMLCYHYITSPNKTGYLFDYGLEAVALPLSDFSIRKKLESNQRVINDFAVSILKLAEGIGIEPMTAESKSAVIPFN